MIKGHCITDSGQPDAHHIRNHRWPTNFAAVPRIGEFVESEEGSVLRVMGVTYCEDYHHGKEPGIKIRIGIA